MGRIEAIRANKGKQIPTVMSTEEVAKIFDHLHGFARIETDVSAAPSCPCRSALIGGEE